jgi:hypothetical protein
VEAKRLRQLAAAFALILVFIGSSKAAASSAPYTHFVYPNKGHSVPRLRRSLFDSLNPGLTAGPIYFRPFGPGA